MTGAVCGQRRSIQNVVSSVLSVALEGVRGGGEVTLVTPWWSRGWGSQQARRLAGDAVAFPVSTGLLCLLKSMGAGFYKTGAQKPVTDIPNPSVPAACHV